MFFLSFQEKSLRQNLQFYGNTVDKKGEIDYIVITDKENVNIEFAFNDSHEGMINVITLYNNIISIVDLRQFSVNAGVNIFNNQDTLMELYLNGDVSIEENNNYLSAFVRFISGELDLSANVKE